jgi:phosphatidylserine/phosphatidylglycerophosphate/cardiolipin synthase-like enzyme
MTASDIRVVVSGSSWMGGGFGSIESALRNLFARANDEVVVVSYAVSGAASILFQQIAGLLQRGIKVRMLINRYDNQPAVVRKELGKLQQQFPRTMLIFSFIPQHEEADLHAKIIIVDRKYALVGSANLPMRGLMDNHELGLVLEGTAVADVARAVDLLMQAPQIVPVIFHSKKTGETDKPHRS